MIHRRGPPLYAPLIMASRPPGKARIWYVRSMNCYLLSDSLLSTVLTCTYFLELDGEILLAISVLFADSLFVILVART